MKERLMLRFFRLNVVAATLVAASCATPNIACLARPQPQESVVQIGDVSVRIVATPADDWSDLLRRSSGWSGADGIYAIPLNGYEAPNEAKETKTLFVFSDTFIGEVDPATLTRFDCTMVNNTLALLESDEPDPEKICFIWRTDNGEPAAAFVPDTPRTRERNTKCWYWLQDGICIGDKVYILPMLIERKPDAPPGWQFRSVGVSLITLPVVDGDIDIANHTQADTPLFHANEERTLYFGAGIMANTKAAGAPDPDGFVYVYGRYEGQGLQLAVARVKPDAFDDLSQWRFWDGTDWSPDIGDAVSLGLGGPELSVCPIPDGPLRGKYLLCSMGLERDLFIRVGESPVGPFGPRINVFRIPETDPEIYTYNAKIHPSLSRPGEWLATYNVNCANWNTLTGNADIYRPRFIRLRFAPGAG